MSEGSPAHLDAEAMRLGRLGLGPNVGSGKEDLVRGFEVANAVTALRAVNRATGVILVIACLASFFMPGNELDLSTVPYARFVLTSYAIILAGLLVGIECRVALSQVCMRRRCGFMYTAFGRGFVLFFIVSLFVALATVLEGYEVDVLFWVLAAVIFAVGCYNIYVVTTYPEAFSRATWHDLQTTEAAMQNWQEKLAGGKAVVEAAAAKKADGESRVLPTPAPGESVELFEERHTRSFLLSRPELVLRVLGLDQGRGYAAIPINAGSGGGGGGGGGAGAGEPKQQSGSGASTGLPSVPWALGGGRGGGGAAGAGAGAGASAPAVAEWGGSSNAPPRPGPSAAVSAVAAGHLPRAPSAAAAATAAVVPPPAPPGSTDIRSQLNPFHPIAGVPGGRAGLAMHRAGGSGGAVAHVAAVAEVETPNPFGVSDADRFSSDGGAYTLGPFGPRSAGNGGGGSTIAAVTAARTAAAVSGAIARSGEAPPKVAAPVPPPRPPPAAPAPGVKLDAWGFPTS